MRRAKIRRENALSQIRKPLLLLAMASCKKRRLGKQNGLCFHLIFGTTQKRSCETSKKKDVKSHSRDLLQVSSPLVYKGRINRLQISLERFIKRDIKPHSSDLSKRPHYTIHIHRLQPSFKRFIKRDLKADSRDV